MNTSFHQRSAKIYQFPVGGRASVGTSLGTRIGIRRDETPAIADATRVCEAACGGSWYHEAAIEDAKRKGEH
jgi:hypothetical protein